MLPAALGNARGRIPPYATGVGFRNAVLGGPGSAAAQALCGPRRAERRGFRTGGSAAHRLLLLARRGAAAADVDGLVAGITAGFAHSPGDGLGAVVAIRHLAEIRSVRMVQAQA